MALNYSNSGTGKTGAGYTTVIDLGWDRIVNQSRALSRSSVKIGFLEGADPSSADKSEGEHISGTTYTMEEIIDHAIANEFGYEPKNLPSRPFMRESIERNKESIEAFIALQIGLLNANRLSINEFFKEIGKFFRKLIVNSIKNGDWKANSEFTVKIGDGYKPLIDTEQMINSVQFKSSISRAKEQHTTGKKI